jgi:hypothetical protein
MSVQPPAGGVGGQPPTGAAQVAPDPGQAVAAQQQYTQPQPVAVHPAATTAVVATPPVQTVLVPVEVVPPAVQKLRSLCQTLLLPTTGKLATLLTLPFCGATKFGGHILFRPCIYWGRAVGLPMQGW